MKIRTLTCVISIIVYALVGCSSDPVTPSQDPPADPELTLEEAKEVFFYTNSLPLYIASVLGPQLIEEGPGCSGCSDPEWIGISWIWTHSSSDNTRNYRLLYKDENGNAVMDHTQASRMHLYVNEDNGSVHEAGMTHVESSYDFEFEDIDTTTPIFNGHADFTFELATYGDFSFSVHLSTYHWDWDGVTIPSNGSCVSGGAYSWFIGTGSPSPFFSECYYNTPLGHWTIDTYDNNDDLLSSQEFPMVGCQIDFNPVQDDIDQSGGEIHSGDYAVEIPAGSLDGAATVTLDYADEEVADEFDGVFETDNTSISLSVMGANVVDDIYLEIPEFDEFSEYTVIGFETDGELIPLTDYESDGEILRITLSPDRLGQRSRIWFGGNIFQLRFSALIGSTHVDPWSGQDPSRPVVLFIHGACASPWSPYGWDINVLTHFEAEVGDVWTLAYPWHDPFWEIVDDVIEDIEGQFDDREIYIVAHSKGGLLARALIRILEERGVCIPKAVFLGTPHYGGLYGQMEEFAQALLQVHYDGQSHLYSLLSLLIHEFPGIVEILPNSPALNVLNTEADLINIPEYLCIVGDHEESGDDGLVECISANLADPSHNGHREEAIFEQMDPVDYAHMDLNEWHVMDNYWLDIADFFGSVESGTDTLLLQPGPIEGVDAHIKSTSPDDNGGDYDIVIILDARTEYIHQIEKALLKFSIPDGIEVVSAELGLWGARLPGGPCPLYVKRILEPWEESAVTWNNQPDVEDLVYGTAHAQDEHLFVTFNIADLVAGWSSGEMPNFGILVETAEATFPGDFYGGMFWFSDDDIEDRRPYIKIVYEQ